MSRHSLGLGLTATVLALPMLVFTATPSMFFGYESSDTNEVIQMTEQARVTGGTYLELEELERAQIDSFITGITGEYEQAGTVINRIDLTGAAGRRAALVHRHPLRSRPARPERHAHGEHPHALRCTPAMHPCFAGL